MSRKTGRNALRKAARTARAAANRATYTKLGLSGFTLGSMAMGGTVIAADAADAPAAGPAKSSEPQELQEVVVTGIRASLQRALDIKQQAIGVVDAVSAEDIGQFPDASIGEALSRIPGVTVNRGSINSMAGGGATTATGNPTGITVRGFGTQFNEILTEGRQVASGNGQTFNFAALGAEYVGELDIHKTPDFALSAGAVGATINVKSPRPFDKPGMQARAFVSANDYQKDGGVKPAGGALFSDTFFDDTFGILVAGDYTKKENLNHHLDDVGWKGTFLNSCQMAGGPACNPDAKGNPTSPVNTFPSWYIQDQAMYLERVTSVRRDGRVALQWRPSEAVLVTLDDNYSSDSEQSNRWQYSTWFGCFPGGCTNVTQDANGTITNFSNGSPSPTDFNATADRTYITTNTPGLNVRWEINDQWASELDAAQSTAHLNPNHTWTAFDIDVGYGPNTDLGTNGYVGGVAVSGDPKTLPYWTAYGPNTVAGTASAFSPNFLGTNPYIVGSHVVPITVQYNTDKINQLKLQGSWHNDNTRVNFGAQFLQDVWDLANGNTLVNGEWQLWSGYGPGSNNIVYYCGSNKCADQHNPPPGAVKVTHGVPIPSSLFSSVNVGNFIPGYNSGNLPQSLPLFNPYAVLNYLITQPINGDYSPNSGYPNYAGGAPVVPINPGSIQHVDRKNYAPFVTADHTFQLGDMSLNGKVGFRYQKTNVYIAGQSQPLQSLAVLPGDVTAYQFNLGPVTPTSAKNSYGYFLPSLDLNLLVQPNLKVRLDYSRTETQPDNSRLIPNITYGGRVDSLNATGNNPNLLPYLSQNFDLGAEWYYASNDYVSVDGFFKHVTQFPVSTVTPITVPGVLDKNGNLAVFQENTYANGEAANVTGVEATWQQMLPLGFGFQVNGTYVHSNANFDPYKLQANQFALPGIGHSANLIAFYQNYGFQARVALQWQGEQLLQIGQEQNGGNFANEPTYLRANTNLDFSTQYDINDHFNVFFEALNLTDNVYHTRGRFPNQTLNVIDYGRSFTMGVRAKL
jgi:iron complex outermembrane receptor protein